MSARAPEIEEHTNRFLLHPISKRLAVLLSKTPVHPNVVSLVGMAFGFSAAYFYFYYDQGYSAVYAFLFMIGWHILDGADGSLARLTGKATIFGKVMDGFADYSVYLSVYVALGIAMSRHYEGPITWLIVLAAASHVVQAAAYERQRESYLFWVYSGQAGKEPGTGPLPTFLPFRWLLIGYLAVQNFLDKTGSIKQKGFDLEIGPYRRKKAAAEFKRRNVNHLHVWALLGANTHTTAIFLFTWFGSPLYYFVFEIFALNAVLLLLLLIKREKDAEFSAFLDKLERRS